MADPLGSPFLTTVRVVDGQDTDVLEHPTFFPSQVYNNHGVIGPFSARTGWLLYEF
jgi:hypothetical protein